VTPWYSGNEVYDAVLAASFGLVAVVAVVAPLVKTPYGRFADPRWGVALSPRLGWFLMELPSTLVFVAVYFTGANRWDPVPLVFLAVWLVHYGNRGFLFPFLIRSPPGAHASFGLMVVASGWLVTSLHGYLNAAYVAEVGTHYTVEWLTDPRFLGGLALYVVSLALNIHSDGILRNLRTREEVARGEKVYRIPVGGLFRWVSSPSYLTELTAWTGFAIATWSLGSVFVLAISLANLVPRALQTHAWYRERFADYPRDRRALVPYLL
jgi:3-oxo-5-alpha-steroid 4-dehydrogenase 1